MRLKSKQRLIGFSLAFVPSQSFYEMHIYLLWTYHTLGTMLGVGEKTVKKNLTDLVPACMDLTAKSIQSEKDITN